MERMNQIEAENEYQDEDQDSDMGELDMDDGIQVEDDGAEEEKIQPKSKK